MIRITNKVNVNKWKFCRNIVRTREVSVRSGTTVPANKQITGYRSVSFSLGITYNWAVADGKARGNDFNCFFRQLTDNRDWAPFI